MTQTKLPDGLAFIAIERIHPCSLQPRVTVSTDLVQKLAESMRAGRHDPLLEVEPVPLQPGDYQIVCGEQRWRAAKEAGLKRVLVRVHERLNYLARLQKQYEENRLRADLTPAEDAHLLLTVKTLRDIAVAEQLLREALVTFRPLADKWVTAAAEIDDHLESLRTLLLKHKLHVIKTERGPAVASLSPWRDTERDLGISEASRKLKLSVLHLEPEVLAETTTMPAQHAPLIAKIDGRERRTELAERAAQLTHRQLLATVRRLREDSQLGVEDAIRGRPEPVHCDPLAFETQLDNLGDLCRQIARLLGNLQSQASVEEREQVRKVLASLVEMAHAFGEAI